MQEYSDRLSHAEQLKQASDQLSRLVQQGEALAVESLLPSFPNLASDHESVLELIYLEWILRRDRGEINSQERFSQRFPSYQQDLAKLLEVDDVMRDAIVEEPFSSGSSASNAIDPNRLSSHDTWSDSNPHAIKEATRIGDYLVLGVIGRGGMGIVYRAKQDRLDRLVALKTLDLIGSLNPQSVARFREEAELVARLQHPNIVQVFETGSHHGIPFYSMELVDGGNLANWLRSQSMKPVQSARLIEVLARAMHQAHLEGIIHRDLKPANILLASSGRSEALELGQASQDRERKGRFEPKIVDFGLAKFLGNTSRQTLSGTAIGTPSYMPPEQLDPNMGEVCPASDVYSLGAILFELLVGVPPFHGPTALETMQMVRHEEVAFPKNARQRVASDLLLICQTCLRKEPNQRYASALDLADDLNRYLQGKPIMARKATLYRRVCKWTQRHPSVTALLVLTSLMGLIVSSLWWRAEEKSRSEHAQRIRGEQMIYARNIALAEFEYKANKLESCQKRLDECQPSLRNWEWHYLSQLCRDSLWESSTSNLPTIAVAISPDARLVASGHAEWGTDRKQPIEVWDLQDRSKKWSLPGHPAGVYDLAFSPDGRQLASAGVEWQNTNQGSVKIWNLENGTERTLTRDNAHVVRFSLNGSTVYVGLSNGLIKEYDAISGEAIGTLIGPKEFVTDLALDASGKYIAATSRDGSLTIWDRESRKALESIVDLSDLRRLAWHPDGKTILVSSYGGNLYEYQWNANRLKLMHTQSHSSVPIIRYSPDGLQLAMAVFGEGAQIQDSKTGKIDRVLRRHNGHINCLAFDANGMRLATGGNDGAVRVWDLTRSQSPVAMYSTRPEKIGTLAAHPSKPEIALAMNSVQRSAGQVGPSHLDLLDLETMKVRKQLRGHSGSVNCLAYLANGNRIMTGGEDAKVLIWDTERDRPLSTFSLHSTGLVSLAFLSDRLAASVERGGDILVWEIETQRVLRQWKGTPTTIRLASIDEQGKQLAIVDDHDLATLWELETGKKIGKRQLQSTITELKLGPHAKQIALGDNSGRVELWEHSSFIDPASSTPAAVIASHTSAITSLNYNSTGNRIVSCSSDESIRLIDAVAGCEVFELDRAKGRAPMAIFNRTGDQITRAEGGNLWHWNAFQDKDASGTRDDQQILLHWIRSQIDRATAHKAWKEADRYRTMLLELQPENDDVYHWRGIVRVRLNQLADAESDLRRALELRFTLRSQYELARLMLKQGKTEEYREACQKLFSETVVALKRTENYSMAWVCCLSSESDIDPSLLRKVLDGSKVVNNPVGAILKVLPDLKNNLEIPGAEKSLRDFETAKEFDSCIYSLVCYRSGDYASAIQHAQTAAKKDPKHAYLPNLIRAMCLGKTGKIAEAKRIYAAAKAQHQRILGLDESSTDDSIKWMAWNELEFPHLLKEAERILGDYEAGIAK